MLKKITSQFIITDGFLGYFPFFPGTIGSILGCIFVWYFQEIFTAYHKFYIILPIWLLITIISTFSVHYFITYIVTEHDPSYIIIDETIAQILIFIFIPINIPTIVAGFLFFRLFDITKVFGIKFVEKIPGALGIMLDDILAAVYVIILLNIYIHLLTLINKITLN